MVPAGGLKALVGDAEELRKAVEFGTACGAFVTQVQLLNTVDSVSALDVNCMPCCSRADASQAWPIVVTVGMHKFLRAQLRNSAAASAADACLCDAGAGCDCTAADGSRHRALPVQKLGL